MSYGGSVVLGVNVIVDGVIFGNVVYNLGMGMLVGMNLVGELSIGSSGVVCWIMNVVVGVGDIDVVNVS